MATDIIVGQLLENAFKYSPDGGTVTVRAQVADPWIEVTVEDEGVGVTDGDHERIFDRFYQGETGDRRRFGGVGIGLFIVRRLAEAQHGQVTAGSRPSGGTTMRLRLPLAVLPRGGDPPGTPRLAVSPSRRCGRLRGAGRDGGARRRWPPGRRR
jgi:signal transduction histidine kinase